MVSDVAGSSGSIAMGKEGTGLPGPLLSLLKELSSIPGIRALAGSNEAGRYNISLLCTKLFIRLIRFYQQLGFSLKEIKSLLEASAPVRKAALQAKVTELEAKDIHLQELIQQAKEYIATLQ